MGVLLGNLGLFGMTALAPLGDSKMLRMVAETGGVLLLFEVGLETDLAKLLGVGWTALAAAVFGISASMGLSYAVTSQLFSGAGWLTHLFIAGTVAATSVGITARVLKDMGKANTQEARIVLGAAVADDVIGLVLLAVVSGLGAAHAAKLPAVLWIVGKAALFLIAAAGVGRYGAQPAFNFAMRMKVPGALLGVSICFCFAMAGISAWAGLAPIVGAFAAGLVLDEVHYKDLLLSGERTVEELLFPINTLLVPVFFVMVGFRVDVRSFASPGVLGFAALITLAAALGKQVCGLAVREGGVSRLAVGIGMIPRGEVSLIFAGLGVSLAVVSQTAYASLVLMVMLTTFITPPLLKYVMFKDRSPSAAAPR